MTDAYKEEFDRLAKWNSHLMQARQVEKQIRNMILEIQSQIELSQRKLRAFEPINEVTTNG